MRQGSIQKLEPGTLLEGGFAAVPALDCVKLAGFDFVARYGLAAAVAKTVGCFTGEGIGSLAPND